MSVRAPRSQDTRSATVAAGRALCALGVLVAAGAAVLAIAQQGEASHFRYGTLSWEPGVVANEAVIDGRMAFRHSYFSSPALGTCLMVASGPGGIDFGDGTGTDLRLLVTYVHPTDDWFEGDVRTGSGCGTVTHTYSAPSSGGLPWLATHSNCCRAGSGTWGAHVNNPNLGYSLGLDVIFTTPNASPVVTMASIQTCPVSAVCTFPVSATDPDGDPLAWTFATPGEAGDPSFVQPGPPHAPNAASIASTTGVVTWDTTGATLASSGDTYYSMAVIVDDGTVRAPVDFFITFQPCAASPLGAPTWLAPSSTTSSITLNWNPVAPPPCGSIVYTVERDGTLPGPCTATPATACTDSPVGACASHTYRVRAENPAATPPVVGPWSSPLTVAAATPAPAAPTPFTVTEGASPPPDAELSWGHPYPGCVSHFEVYRSPPGAVIASVASPTMTYNDGTVLPCVPYAYRVRAIDVVGIAGPWSAIGYYLWDGSAIVSPSPCPPPPPSATRDAAGASFDACFSPPGTWGHFIASHGLDPATGAPSTTASCYDVHTNVWSPLSNALVARSQAAGAARSGPGVVYAVVGGQGPSCSGPGGTCDTFEVYEPIYTLSWTDLTPTAPLPVAVASPSAVWAPSPDRLFVMGGRQCPVLGACAAQDVVQVFDMATMSWSLGPSMPVARSDFSAVLMANPKTPGCQSIFVFGGHDGLGGGYLASMDAFDLCTMSWLASGLFPDMPFAAAKTVAGSTLVGTNPALCVVGGVDMATSLYQVQVLELHPSMPTTWSSYGSSAARPGLAGTQASMWGSAYGAPADPFVLADGPGDAVATTISC